MVRGLLDYIVQSRARFSHLSERKEEPGHGLVLGVDGDGDVVLRLLHLLPLQLLPGHGTGSGGRLHVALVPRKGDVFLKERERATS